MPDTVIVGNRNVFVIKLFLLGNKTVVLKAVF